MPNYFKKDWLTDWKTERKMGRTKYVLVHGVLTLWLQQNLVGWGNADPSMPQRIEVAYVRALAPAAPPPPPAAVARAQPKPAKARRIEPPAAQPECDDRGLDGVLPLVAVDSHTRDEKDCHAFGPCEMVCEEVH